jgi:very-short-patch-repair endonuclease
MVVVEVDGGPHRRRRSYAEDLQRQTELEAAGYVVVRATPQDAENGSPRALAELAELTRNPRTY